MNCKQAIKLGLSIAGAMLFASAANAQIVNVVTGVGSSALYPTVTIAAVTPDPIAGGAAPCGTNLFTSGNTAAVTATGIDPRPTTLPEVGNISVAWDGTAAGVGTTTVCAFLSVDSVVGNRLFYGTTAAGNGTLNFVVGGGAVVGNKIAGFPDTSLPPANVVAALNGTHFNVAYTDIRPEDAVYAYNRAANDFGYGSNAFGIGTPIYSSFSNTNAQVVKFGISSPTVAGTDPVSGANIPVSVTTPLGAEPVVVFISNNGAMAGGTLPSNISVTTAGLVFSGRASTTQGAFGSFVVNARLEEIQREPLSGTDNTFEFGVVHSRAVNGGNYSQEDNPVTGTYIAPTPAACFVGGAAFAPCTNPMYIQTASTAFRYRAIGTGEMVKAVNGTTTVPTTFGDRIGYAFYSLGTFYIGGSHLKYLTLGGTDPLYDTYLTNNGSFGTCAGSVPGGTFKCTTTLPNFYSMKSGGYHAWSVLRAVTYGAPAGKTATLLQAAKDQAAWALANPANSGIAAPNTVIQAIADFVPYGVFNGAGVPVNYTPLIASKSHYGISGISPNNGTLPAAGSYCAPDQASPNCFEEGGDMAGVTITNATDALFFNLTGSEQTGFIQ